ncbi:MAG: 2Fe-2S iron-sulfur cluster binding domain-containing protein [Candidatus Izemoplasma sp.]|nr:2Fe-2S iron-sulfur cluster binding domain-containing protein [Candidatus Izemoplasma sp.]
MNLFIPLIILGVLLLITGILILLDQLLGSNKEKILTINNDTEIKITQTDTLLNTLAKEEIFIPSACGGKATCGLCKCKVTSGAGDTLPTEEPFLSEAEKEAGVRLSCQVKVRDDMHIELPLDQLNAQEYKAKVTAVEDLTYDIVLLRVKLIEPDTMDFKPGQYAQIEVPGLEVIRAYSIASNPKHKDMLEFIIRYVPKGKATTYIHKAVIVGDTISLTGPYGDFYLQEESDKEMICIAGGSGKAPIRSILSYLKDQGMPRKVTYFFGAKSKKDLYYTEEFRDLEKEFDNFKYVPALSDPDPDDNWEGETGLITEVVDRMTGDLSDKEAYLCGSPGMIDACNKVLEDHNLPDQQCFYDKFS